MCRKAIKVLLIYFGIILLTEFFLFSFLFYHVMGVSSYFLFIMLFSSSFFPNQKWMLNVARRLSSNY